MKLLVDTPFGEIIATDATEVVVPGEVGEMGILTGHAPLITLMAIGELRYTAEGATHHASVARGYVEVSGDVIRVVTEACEPADKIDVDRAKAAEAKAEKALAELPLDAEVDAQRETWTRALKRARTRQAVATKAR